MLKSLVTDEKVEIAQENLALPVLCLLLAEPALDFILKVHLRVLITSDELKIWKLSDRVRTSRQLGAFWRYAK